MGRGGNAGHQYFLLFPQCHHMAKSSGTSKQQSPIRVVVCYSYSHHAPLQWAKCQESCQTEENMVYYCLTVLCVT